MQAWTAELPLRHRYLSEEEAAEGLPESLQTYSRIAWRFLESMGFINFGVSPQILARHGAQPPTRGTVLVIGAGLAGQSPPVPTSQTTRTFLWATLATDVFSKYTMSLKSGMTSIPKYLVKLS